MFWCYPDPPGSTKFGWIQIRIGIRGGDLNGSGSVGGVMSGPRSGSSEMWWIRVGPRIRIRIHVKMKWIHNTERNRTFHLTRFTVFWCRICRVPSGTFQIPDLLCTSKWTYFDEINFDLFVPQLLPLCVELRQHGAEQANLLLRDAKLLL